MASPPSSREDSPSHLPAPYEDPWRRLATDLAAVVATAGLKARELWRLNREGALSTPAFWPRGVAPLFWPLLVALGLALMVGLVSRLPGWRQGLPAAQRTAAEAPQASGRGTGSPPEIPRTSPTPDSRQADQPGGEGDGAALPPATAERIPEDTGSAGRQSAASRPVDPGGGSPGLTIPWPRRQAPGADQTDREAGGPGMREAGTDPGPQPTPGAPSTTLRDASSPLGSGDRPDAESAADNAAAARPSLLTELVGAESPAWILALEQRPAEGLLRLRLDDGYGALPLVERRTLAERWLGRCRELGYERLELVNASGRLLARPARVGSGMILLDALSTSP